MKLHVIKTLKASRGQKVTRHISLRRFVSQTRDHGVGDRHTEKDHWLRETRSQNVSPEQGGEEQDPHLRRNHNVSIRVDRFLVEDRYNESLNGEPRIK